MTNHWVFVGVIVFSLSGCARNSSSASSSLVEQASTTDCAGMLQGLSAAGAQLADIERLDAGQLEVTWTLPSGEQTAMCAADVQGRWNQVVRASWPSGNSNVRSGWPDTECPHGQGVNCVPNPTQ